MKKFAAMMIEDILTKIIAIAMIALIDHTVESIRKRKNRTSVVFRDDYHGEISLPEQIRNHR